MRMTYDPEADAAFIYLVDAIGDGELDHAVELDLFADGSLTLAHKDAAGKVLGIEIVGASSVLRPESLTGPNVEQLR